MSDDWSTQLLIDELSEGYRAARSQRAPVLPPLPIQHLDFTLWSRSEGRRAREDAQLEYWRATLESGDYTLSLPVRRAGRDAGLDAREPPPLRPVERARGRAASFARAEGVTPFTFLLATTKLLLAAYSDQRDVRVGMPVANRERETQALLGCFVNTLVLRSG